MMLVFILMVLLVTAPPIDPQCKEGEKAMCTRVCASTLLFCGPFATWENGEFKEIPYKDCNTTECWWNCMCLPKIK